MKKIVLFAAIALVGSTFTSCKKDYNCTCVTKVTGYPDQTTVVKINATKSDAKKTCDASASSTSGGTTGTITCSL